MSDSVKFMSDRLAMSWLWLQVNWLAFGVVAIVTSCI